MEISSEAIATDTEFVVFMEPDIITLYPPLVSNNIPTPEAAACEQQGKQRSTYFVPSQCRGNRSSEYARFHDKIYMTHTGLP